MGKKNQGEKKKKQKLPNQTKTKYETEDYFQDIY